MEYGALWESWLLDGDLAFGETARADAEIYVELALDYAHAGCSTKASLLLHKATACPSLPTRWAGCSSCPGSGKLRWRISGAPAACSMKPASPTAWRMCSFSTPPCGQSGDSRAPYHLGNFWYAHRRYDEAIACWERSRELQPDFPTVQRNLGLAYYNKRSDPRSCPGGFERRSP